MRIVIGAGGTAGHIFPALATAQRLREDHGAEVLFLGRREGQEGRLVPAAGYGFEGIEARPFTRGISLGAIGAPFAALRAAARARPLIRRADAVLGMGGYVSVPVALAARRERVPLVLHEQNAIPGLANRVGARWAARVALAFAEAARHLPRGVATDVTGNPVRDSIAGVAANRERLVPEAHAALGLEPGRRTVVVFGGSQGAVRLNQAVVEASARLASRTDLQIVLLTGPRHHAEVDRRLPKTGGLLVRAIPFLDRMELAYSVADLAVARAGAMTVAELTACGIPSLLVPYPYATANHQEANARAVERAGGARVVLDDRMHGGTLASAVERLLGDPGELERMRRASAGLGRPDAARSLASLVARVARTVRR